MVFRLRIGYLATMDTAKSFKDLLVWQKAHAWVLQVYRLTTEFPPDERFGLTSQLRRAARSVSSNIVEGFKRRSTGDKLRFLNIAEASLAEATYQLLLADDLDYGKTSDLQNAADEVDKLLNAYSRAIERNRTS